MGYCASGSGVVVVKNIVEREVLETAYSGSVGEKLAEYYGIKPTFSDNTYCNMVEFIRDLLEKQEAFDYFHIDEVWLDTILITLEHPNEKYHDDTVSEFLNVLAPVTVQGEIDFIGEDDCLWEFKFEDGVFEEYSGSVVFDGDHPRCKKYMCAFCKNGRCYANCLRSEVADNVKEENGHVKECSAYIHMKTLLGFARKVDLPD